MLLDRIHALLRPRTYFEIGVARGSSLAQARPPTTLALGVDPAMDIDSNIQVRAKLFRLSSDEFFRDLDVWTELEGQPVVRDGLIRRGTEYWVDEAEQEPPDWRRVYSEPMSP
ncbi:MAG: hypothetical protein ACRDH8_12810 [Actinomycetota bacterium]